MTHGGKRTRLSSRSEGEREGGKGKGKRRRGKEGRRKSQVGDAMQSRFNDVVSVKVGVRWITSGPVHVESGFLPN